VWYTNGLIIITITTTTSRYFLERVAGYALQDLTPLALPPPKANQAPSTMGRSTDRLPIYPYGAALYRITTGFGFIGRYNFLWYSNPGGTPLDGNAITLDLIVGFN
jgi:hypothetical protein